jgi:hypothetical protein
MSKAREAPASAGRTRPRTGESAIGNQRRRGLLREADVGLLAADAWRLGPDIGKRRPGGQTGSETMRSLCLGAACKGRPSKRELTKRLKKT